MPRHIAILASPLFAAFALFCGNVVTADDTGWTSLFNGKNLNGWVVKCRPEDKDKVGYWKVVDGTITAETPPGSKHNYIWLLTEKEYGDFELRLKIQTYATTTGNSGVQCAVDTMMWQAASTGPRLISILPVPGDQASSTTRRGRRGSGYGPTWEPRPI